MDDRERTGVAVVVPAAGRGTRLGGRPKQLRRLGDASLLVQTLRRFERHPVVDHLVVVAPEAEQARRAVEGDLNAATLSKLRRIVTGGPSRQASVYRGVQAVPDGAEIVLVHDAVRPFVYSEHIQAVIDAIRAGGAAALAVPVTDTLRRSAGDRFGETVPRDDLYHMQTPQGARRDWLDDAHARAARDGWTATDDVALLQRAGYPVRVVRGSRHNIKVTTAADWTLAQLLWAGESPPPADDRRSR